MAITPVSIQSTSTATLQNQEQQLLNQIKSLQSKDADGNAAQIKILQQKYKALLLQQQQQTQAVIPQSQQNVKVKETNSESKAPEAPSSSTASSPASQGINIKA